MTTTKKVLLGLFLLEAVWIGTLVHHSMGRLKNVHVSANKFGSIVRLHGVRGNFVCSGTVTSPNTIVTAAHCLAGATMSTLNPIPTFEIRPSTEEPVGIIGYLGGYNGQADQAVLIGDFQLFDTRNVVTDPKTIIKRFENGKNLMTCGYPYGGQLFCLPINNPKQFLFQFKATSYLFPGMSGGPVIDQETGSILAVNTAVMANREDGDTFVILSPTVEIFASTDTKDLVK